jgi:hypothetical protein
MENMNVLPRQSCLGRCCVIQRKESSGIKKNCGWELCLYDEAYLESLCEIRVPLGCLGEGKSV